MTKCGSHIFNPYVHFPIGKVPTLPTLLQTYHIPIWTSRTVSKPRFTTHSTPHYHILVVIDTPCVPYSKLLPYVIQFPMCTVKKIQISINFLKTFHYGQPYCKHKHKCQGQIIPHCIIATSSFTFHVSLVTKCHLNIDFLYFISLS